MNHAALQRETHSFYAESMICQLLAYRINAMTGPILTAFPVESSMQLQTPLFFLSDNSAG
jgi:hypothetical protein